MVFAIRMKEAVVIVERRDELMAVGVVRPSERSATRHACGTIRERLVMGRFGKGYKVRG
jgi:archaeosine-15-forming tRNA-guanine transglycosylase